VVVKIGSSTLTNPRGRFRLNPVAGLVAEVCALQAQGHRMLLVSSGAVSSGMGVLRRKSRPTEVVDMQAAAAVGQGRLFHIYTELFAHDEVVTAQVLLTAFDVAARTQYINARNTLRRLLEWRVVPIINENDTTSTDELCFGDNDALAAQVALLVKADMLILLTDTEGLYTADPREDSGAQLISTVEDMSDLELRAHRGCRSAWLRRYGEQGEQRSYRYERRGGDHHRHGGAARGLAGLRGGRTVGTRFPARPLGLHDYKLWLLYGKPAKGKVVVEAGAAKALKGKGSLLPVGVRAVEGEFAAGDAVLVVDEDGVELAKGLVSYSSKELERVKGLHSSRVAEMLPQASPEAIHRDYLVRMC
jgi:glutamate 5-kinase